MRQVREVLGLTTAGVGLNEIARRVGVAPSTVRLTLQRLASAGLSWPLPAEMTDTALETALFAAAGTKQGHRRHVEPDWAEIHRELKRKHVTLTMLWDEYIERCPEGYRYSRFCELYRSWASRLSVTMRQADIGGDKLFVDGACPRAGQRPDPWAGDTVPVIVDRLTGQVRPAQIFVAVMGASNFTYAEASWTQALADWIGAHTRAFAAIGGVPKLLVPDNTKSLPSRKRGWLSSRPVSTSRRSIGPQPPLGQALRREGGPLRYRDPAGSAARQGEGRSCGADHRAMVARPPAPPSLLQFGRTQYDDRRVVAAAQRRTPDPAARCHPPGAVRRA
jgi:transposase